ncbi:MAG: UMP kinase [Pseudomonadota bacterium]
MQFPLHRCLLKISGELLGGAGKFGIDPDAVKKTAREIAGLKEALPDIQLSIVVGGGNFFRGASLKDETISRLTADTMGMLSTIINALALQDALKSSGVDCRTQTSFEIRPGVAEPFVRDRALKHLEKGRVVVFAGGTGNPFFSTDTAAALRASEIDAEAVLKGTKVDGIYDKDPVRNKDAVFFEKLRFEEALEKKLGVMDATAFALCMQQRLPIIVFNALREGSILKVIRGERIGTLVY